MKENQRTHRQIQVGRLSYHGKVNRPEGGAQAMYPDPSLFTSAAVAAPPGGLAGGQTHALLES
jgi:hypothetical protein